MSSRKEWALIVSLLLGAILAPINSTMIAVALSSISHTYNESIASITWVVRQSHSRLQGSSVTCTAIKQCTYGESAFF